MTIRATAAVLATHVILCLGTPLSYGDSFKPVVDGNLTNPANWTQGTLPAPSDIGWATTEQPEALFLSQDLRLQELIFFTNYPTSIDLKGQSLQSDISMNRTSADVVGKSLSFKNGSITGKLTVDAPTSLENVQINGSFQSTIAAETGTQFLLKHVAGSVSNWSVRQESFGTQSVLMNGESNIDFGSFLSQQLHVTEKSEASFDTLRASGLTIDQGSKITSSESYLQSIEAAGAGTEVYLGKVTQYANARISLNVHDGAFVRSGEMDFPPNLVHAPYRNITVEGANSKVVLDASASGVIMMRSDNTSQPYVSVTNGAELEINGQLNVLGVYKLQPGRVEVIDASINGSLILSYSQLHLEKGLVTGQSLLMSGGTLDGHGKIDVPTAFLGSSTIDPLGLLTFTGSISGTSNWMFNIDSRFEFDQVHVIGGFLFSQNLFVSFADGFKGKVGDIFDILNVDGNFDVGQSLLTHLQVDHLPAGYAYQAILGDHSLSIQITSVPETSVLLSSFIGIVVLVGLTLAKTNRRLASLPAQSIRVIPRLE